MCLEAGKCWRGLLGGMTYPSIFLYFFRWLFSLYFPFPFPFGRKPFAPFYSWHLLRLLWPVDLSGWAGDGRATTCPCHLVHKDKFKSHTQVATLAHRVKQDQTYQRVVWTKDGTYSSCRGTTIRASYVPYYWANTTKLNKKCLHQ